MKIQETRSVALDFGNEVYLNTYVSSWSGNVELKFMDYESDGSEYKMNVTLPLDKARALARELNEDLQNYDKEQARKLAEAKAENADAE
tara:strand:+ start:306 stop:572 length:267 start_codon:yes stop_codon:yes gene_type:complete